MTGLDELPWQIKVDALGYSSIYGTDEDGDAGDLIAHCFADHEYLIAAAPAMLEALEAALPMLRMLEKFGEDNVWRPAKRNREAFEAALARARGEAA